MIETNDTLVSIGLPTFNRANILKRAIDSLLNQAYSNFELIISDNTSTDDTQKICLEYSQKDDRIRYFRQDKNIGMGQFDFLASKIRGDYFMLASDDDWWHPDFILTLKEALDTHSEYGIAMSSLRQVHEDGTIFNEVLYAGAGDVSKFGYGRVFDAVVLKNPPAHFFVMGLFRIGVLKSLAWESVPHILGSDKILMYEAALFTRFYAVQKILWDRTSSYVPDAKRYTGDYRRIVTERWAYSKHLKAAVSRLFRSPNISMKKKIRTILTDSIAENASIFWKP